LLMLSGLGQMIDIVIHEKERRWQDRSTVGYLGKRNCKNEIKPLNRISCEISPIKAGSISDSTSQAALDPRPRKRGDAQHLFT